MVSKNNLIVTTAKKIGITQKDCAMVVDAFLNSVADAVADKEDVSLGDLGKFVVVKTKATKERVMKSGLTGQEVVVPAKPEGIKASFKISKKIKDIVAGK